MGKAVKVLGGTVFAGIGYGLALINPALSGVFIKIGWGLIMGAAAEALAPKHRLPGSAGVQIEYGGQVEPRVIVYGTLRVGGLGVIP